MGAQSSGMYAQGMLGAKATSRLGSVVKDLAAQTAGLMPRDLAGLVADAGIAAVMQVPAGVP